MLISGGQTSAISCATCLVQTQRDLQRSRSHQRPLRMGTRRGDRRTERDHQSQLTSSQTSFSQDGAAWRLRTLRLLWVALQRRFLVHGGEKTHPSASELTIKDTSVVRVSLLTLNTLNTAHVHLYTSHLFVCLRCGWTKCSISDSRG